MTHFLKQDSCAPQKHNALFFQVPEAHQRKTEEPQLQPRVKICLSFPKGLTLHSPAAIGQFNSFPRFSCELNFQQLQRQIIYSFPKGCNLFHNLPAQLSPTKTKPDFHFGTWSNNFKWFELQLNLALKYLPLNFCKFYSVALTNHKKLLFTGNYLPLNSSHKPTVLAAHRLVSAVVDLTRRKRKSNKA